MMRALNFLKIPEPAEFIQDKNERIKTYTKWRLRTICSLLIGTFMYQLLWKNASLAMPMLMEQLDVSPLPFANPYLSGPTVIAYSALVFGIGTIVHAILLDHVNIQNMFIFGLVSSALINICIGFSHNIQWVWILLILNGWFQSIAFPACVRWITQWCRLREIGTVWGLMIFVTMLANMTMLTSSTFLVSLFGWRGLLMIPAGAGIIMAFWLRGRLRGTPSELGLPSPERVNQDDVVLGIDADEKMGVWELFVQKILKNRNVWAFGGLSIIIFILQTTFETWIPRCFVLNRGGGMAEVRINTAIFSIAGAFGAVIWGFLSDHFWGSRRNPLITFSLFITAIGFSYFIVTPKVNPLLDPVVLGLMGLVISGTFFLGRMATVDFALRRAGIWAFFFTGWMGKCGVEVANIGAYRITASPSCAGITWFLIGMATLGGVGYFLLRNVVTQHTLPH